MLRNIQTTSPLEWRTHKCCMVWIRFISLEQKGKKECQLQYSMTWSVALPDCVREISIKAVTAAMLARHFLHCDSLLQHWLVITTVHHCQCMWKFEFHQNLKNCRLDWNYRVKSCDYNMFFLLQQVDSLLTPFLYQREAIRTIVSK